MGESRVIGWHQRFRYLGLYVVISLLSSCGKTSIVKQENDVQCCESHCLEATIEELRSTSSPVAYMDVSQELTLCADESTIIAQLERLGGERYKQLFFRSMLALYKGRFADSGALVSGLLQSEDGEQWGLLGMAEMAMQTENIRDLKVAVDILESRDIKGGLHLSRWDYFQYKIYFLMEIGEYDEAARLLDQEASSIDGTTSLAKMHTKILILLHFGRYQEMDKLLRTLEKTPGDERNGMLLKANIVRIMEGPQGALAFLESARRRYPRDKYIQHQYALALIENGDHDKGLSILRWCAITMPFDINGLVDYVENEQAASEARMARSQLEAVEVSVPRLQLMKARSAYVKGDRAEMKRHLDVIEAIHPFYVGYLWFLYEFLSQEESYDQAAGVLKRLSKVDPLGVDVLAERVRTETRLGRPEVARQLLENLKSSERYKDDTLLCQLEELVSREPPRQSLD